jgi:hypothetical protein
MDTSNINFEKDWPYVALIILVVVIMPDVWAGSRVSRIIGDKP